MKNEIKKEVFEKISSLIIAALGLVAALAWNGAILAVFKEIFGAPDQLLPMLIYAVFVTVVAVIATLVISNIAKKFY